MSDKILVKKMYEDALERRRLEQLNCLKEWNASKITPRQCIEKILELEKFIPFNKEIIKEHFEEDEEEDTNG